MLPLEMNAREQMCRMPIVGSGTMLSFPHAEFPQDFLDQLEYLRPPSQLFFQGTDHSFLVGRTMTTCIWVPHGVPVIFPDPASTTQWFVLEFPFKFCGQSFVRYYSAEVADKIWSLCQRVAATYGINIYQDEIYDVHPVHRAVEGRYRLDQPPTPLILSHPLDMQRRDYPNWIEQFVRDTYELLLDRSLQSSTPRTVCLRLTFGFPRRPADLSKQQPSSGLRMIMVGSGRTTFLVLSLNSSQMEVCLPLSRHRSVGFSIGIRMRGQCIP